ncbi:MAG: 5-(carboxyamino)imidazole ribonucleotide mutase [Deltaproteobacteria bacterium]|nr:5-(carboxyamino)imidazole ribonucleotide mutase [Deltaproteobacteria bacterium]
MKKKEKPVISIVMGSNSDVSVMEEASSLLKEFGIAHEMVLTSAHRSPERTTAFAGKAESRGIRIIIAGAGAAAHLAGVIASQTALPVIGVPIESSPIKGLDALLSTVQMPGGVPVATMALGKAGAKNAALMAVRILALEDGALKKKLAAYRKTLAENIQKDQERLDAR